MFMGLIPPKGGQVVPQRLSLQFPLSLRQRKYLVACPLDGSGLVDIHMAALHRHHALTGPQQRVDDDRVDLGAAHEKVNRSIRAVTRLPDALTGSVTDGVRAVSWLFFQVSLRQTAQISGCAPSI